MGPAALGQTITIVDKSGKVISTSRTLLNVFKEAKAAYRERKAEIVAERQADIEARRARKALEQLSFNEQSGQRDSRRAKSRSHTRHSEHPSGDRRRSILRDEGYDIASASGRERMIRRHTEHGQELVPRRELPLRSASYSDAQIDMDLAYGEIPPPLPIDEEAELKGLMVKVKMLLDEAHCVQHSATATIASLQQNPDALAAVALTLAEISNVAAKMAPGALAAMKGSFPAVFALLASPQFLIAAGVGVGMVVVALGGYKIIKKIKARQDEEMDELQEVDTEISRIEAWRRGVTDDETASIGTSVEGEYITPEAAALRMAEQEEEERASRRERRSRKSSRNHTSTKRTKTIKEEKRSGEKKRKPSTLQLLFR